MSKFNSTNTIKTKNKSGHVAYDMEIHEKLMTMVLTTMFNEKKFYGDNSNELIELAKKVNSEFLAKLIIFTRTKFNLRSVSHALIAVLANRGDGKKYVKTVCSEAIIRPDDMTEIMAYYINNFGKPIPNSLKKGIAIGLNKFNEYSLAKYNGGKKQVKLRDLLRIVHPKAKDKSQSDLFKKIIDDSLEVPYTWETELSAKGNTREVWEDLIDSGKVGYMALLRNLRNIAINNPKNLNVVLDRISKKENVLKSKQLPFRYYSAWNAIMDSEHLKENTQNLICETIEKAIMSSIENIHKIHGKTLIAIDTSGSMSMLISTNSDVRCTDIARIFASIGNYICDDCDIVAFNTNLEEIDVSKSEKIITEANNIPFNGGGTYLKLPFQKILNDKIRYDRVILISDNEINSDSWTGGYKKTCQSIVDKYRNEVNPDLWVHAVDIQGYGTQQFQGKNTSVVAGWSERIFEFMKMAEEGMNTLIEEINKISL